MAQTLDNILQQDEETITVQSYLSMILDSPPSCLQFVPTNTAYPHHFVVGTYSLDTGENTDSFSRGSIQPRTGSLQLFALKDQEL